MNELPSDGATTRLHRLYLLVEHCAAFSEGCSETQLIKYGLGLGLIASTILRYLSDLGPKGMDLITRNGNKYHVTDSNYIAWAEAKGFRDPVYFVKCRECKISYGSTLSECPKCHAENKNLNELGGYTHTPLDSTLDLKNEKTSELTTEPETHIHQKTNNEESLPKENRVKEGREAEKRVVKLLTIFGSALLGKGRGGEPDVLFNSHKAKYCVEVKSVENQVRTESDSVNGYKVGVVSLSRGQWVSLSSFGEANGMEPLMIVEVKIRGAQNLYHFIKRDQIDHKVYSTDAKHIRISVHDLPIMSVHSYREGVPLVGEFRL